MDEGETQYHGGRKKFIFIECSNLNDCINFIETCQSFLAISHSEINFPKRSWDKCCEEYKCFFDSNTKAKKFLFNYRFSRKMERFAK